MEKECVNLYNITQGQITFIDIENFCKEEHEEDLILDYKIDWPGDLSRILCGMANVQGGMVLIGVGTQPGTRKPAWPAPGVVGTDDSLRQRVIQIAYDNIYPPVFPQIDVVRLPTDAARAIVVIRVEASRLLHAIDQRRKVYIRVFDHSRGVDNDLANLSQLEWLFQQRQKSIELRQTLLSRARDRALRWIASDIPLLTVCVAPVFPQRQLVRTPSEMRDIAHNIGVVNCRRGSTSITIPSFPRWRTTSEGAFVEPYESERLPQYLEVGSHGLVYFEQACSANKERELSTTGLRLIGAVSILSVFDIFLNFVAKFFERASLHGPFHISASLRNVAGHVLDQRHPYNRNPFIEPGPNRYSQDDLINLYNAEHQATNFISVIDEIIKEITTNLMWGFGFPESREELEEYMADNLK